MIGEDITTFASLVAQVEDAGPGVMRVLRPLGMGPAQYAKMLAEWKARMERSPALQATFDGALAAARRGELRALLTGTAPSRAVAPAQQAASFQRAPVAGPRNESTAPQHAKLAGTSLAVDVPRRAPLPFMKGGGGGATGAALTLEQHASMTAELAARPDLAMATLGRYGVTPEAKRATDEHYHAAMAGDGEVKAAWERAYRTYGEWLVNAGWTP